MAANTSTPPAVLKLNTRVTVAAGPGIIRFVGQTSFAAGKWVGVELDAANGKNDGSVGGKRYFTCSEGRGMFVKPVQIRLLVEDDQAREVSPTPSKPPSRAPSRNLVASTSRPASAVSRPSTTTTSTRPVRAPTTSTLSGRSSVTGTRSPSPLKLPTKSTAPRLGTRTVSTSSTTSSTPRIPSSTSSTSSTRPLSRLSIAQILVSPTPRALVRPSSPRKLPTSTSTTNFAPPPGGTPRAGPSIGRPRGASIVDVATPRARSAVISPKLVAFGMKRTMSSGSALSAGESLMSEEPLEEEQGMWEDGVEEREDPFSLRAVESRKLAEATVPKREHEELQAKLRILEARRADDRERLREVDRLKEEAEEWLKVREKSKAKIIEMSAELKDLRKQNRDLSTERDTFETKFEDLSDQVEISLLDKEVAEERFEAAESSLETVKERVAELEVEVAVLRDENARMEGAGDHELVHGGDEPRSSLAFVQLEKQNGRLKDALVRLRDLTSESDAEQRRRISDLEKELDLTSDLQSMFDNNAVELERAEEQVEDLKAQLDDAMGAEDMLEQLTERNLTLSEKIEEMHGIIEDLEALKELNDELEENHIETERQMQEEIDLKDLQLRDQTRRGESLEESLADYEATIGQFRELVLSLQGDLENLRHHQASQQTESQSLTSQSQAMLNLNLKLQSSVLKGQVKTIDLELRKLDAMQAVEHLAIMKPYLLPAFFEDDSDAVDSLLFFERLAYKADLVSMVIEQKHNVAESLNTTVPENLVGICETRAKLARFSALNKRFAAQLKRCSPEVFLKMGRIYHEVSATEKRIDTFIESLRKEELREVECGREVDGFIAQAEHLAEMHLQESLLDLAEREHSYISALDLDFDTIAAAAGFTKQALAMISKDPDVLMEIGDANLDDLLFKPLQHLVNQARNSKVITKKLLRRLDDLVANSSALSAEHAQGFETLAYNSSAIATAAAKLASDIAHYCSEVRTSKRPFQVSAVLAIAQEVAATELGKQTQRPLDEISALLGQLSQDIGTTLAAAMDPEHTLKLAYTPPWIARVTELQSNAAINVDAERKVLKLNEEMRDLVREMRTKDQSYQESAVKIELMEKRMESVKKQAEAILELEGELVKSKKQERAYEEAIETLQGDLDTMEQENNKLKQSASVADKQGATATPGESEIVSYEGNMETSRLIEQIDALRGAVRFLRSENSYLKSQDLLATLDALPTYSLPAPLPEPTGLPSFPTPPSQDPDIVRRAFATESKLLLREARVLSATPRVVDLSLVRPGGKSGWQPSARRPENQYWAEKERARSLGRRVDRLWAMRPVALVSI